MMHLLLIFLMIKEYGNKINRLKFMAKPDHHRVFTGKARALFLELVREGVNLILKVRHEPPPSKTTYRIKN
jgi:hypothetical protein